MGFKYAAVGFAGLASIALSVAAPAATFNFGGVVLDYDDTTVFGGPSIITSGTQISFEWSFPDSVNVAGELETAGASFALPGFVVTAEPNYALSGPIAGFIGKLSYTQTGDATVSATVSGFALLDSLPVAPNPVSFTLTKTPTLLFSHGESGYLSASGELATGEFTRFSFLDATLDLKVAQGLQGGLGLITASDQNKYRVTFNVSPVPVPVPAALWLLAPAVVSLATRRRTKA